MTQEVFVVRVARLKPWVNIQGISTSHNCHSMGCAGSKPRPGRIPWILRSELSKFEANMNYIPPSPPSSMKQCNKSATVKFHMELLLTTTTLKQSRSGATPTQMQGLNARLCVSLRQWNAIAAIDIFDKKGSIPIIDALIYFYMLLFIIYLNTIKTLLCHTEIEINRVYFLRFLHKISYMIFKIRY